MGENYITLQDEKGNINISEDVIVTMVRNTIEDVEGVAGLATAAGADMAELIGVKTAVKGIKVQFNDDTIRVDAIILVKYGANIVEVAKKVQDVVTQAVLGVTGIEKAQVNVHVSGVAFDR